MGSIGWIKIPTMIVKFLEVVIFGLIPKRVEAFKENKLVLALSNGFSGGLFLAIGFIHLLPEANENFVKYFWSIDDEEE